YVCARPPQSSTSRAARAVEYRRVSAGRFGAHCFVRSGLRGGRLYPRLCRVSVLPRVHPHMKIIVTGALGHIGSALIRALPDRFAGAEVVMIDNMATLRYSSLFDLPKRGRYSFIEADVRYVDLRPLFKDAHA